MILAQCPECGTTFEYQRDTSGRWILAGWGAFTGGSFGLSAGNSIGIALMGTAISGLWPVAILGAVLAGLAGHSFGRILEMARCPECGTNMKLE